MENRGRMPGINPPLAGKAFLAYVSAVLLVLLFRHDDGTEHLGIGRERSRPTPRGKCGVVRKLDLHCKTVWDEWT
jgi:hypothetical protein